MHEALAYLERHGVGVIFLLVFVDQLGVPLPSVPLLLVLGALAGTGRVDPLTVLAFATLGSVCADWLWYELGRRKGSAVLGWMCRFSLEPDSCVSRTHGAFARYGVKSLLFAKFVPGYDTVAPPLAGILGVRTIAFLAWSVSGAALWVAVYAGAGYVFSDRIEAVAERLDAASGLLAVVLGGMVVGYVGWKFVQRQRVLRAVRTARITPEELSALMTDGRAPAIVDARSDEAVRLHPVALPGAIHVPFEDADARAAEIPRDREVVVYCS